MISTLKQLNLSRRMAGHTAISLVIAASLAACGEKALPQSKPHPVLVSTVHNVYNSAERTFTGIVSARHESAQGFRTGGKVAARMVEVGQNVVAGQALARLDPADYELGLQAAEAQLQAARVDAEQAASDEARFRRLLEDHSVSVADHERQKARADAAAARQAQAARQLDLARNRSKYTTLVAEFNGVITSLKFETGQIVAEGQPVVTIANLSELEVVADLPEEMAGSVNTLTASATFLDTQALSLALKLREISPAAAAQTRTYRVRFSIADKSPAIQQALHLGMTANLHLSKKEGELTAVLPATAVWKTDGHTMIWQVDNSGRKLIAKPVEVLRYTNEAVQVRRLADGAKVVSAGIQKLVPGIDIVPVERSGSGMNLSTSAAHTAMKSTAGTQL
ncbi:MAG TPA: efflux RND transporter periplasmic adaptor subunit [Gallionella sp.]|nr:MAG: hypothetical protein A2Z87_05625 [Gallionellales bacterium GWA2_54_124]HCI52469.1 efflux RND transporter periplasmic adaptor subunit [Gallionella sp.]